MAGKESQCGPDLRLPTQVQEDKLGIFCLDMKGLCVFRRPVRTHWERQRAVSRCEGDLIYSSGYGGAETQLLTELWRQPPFCPKHTCLLGRGSLRDGADVAAKETGESSLRNGTHPYSTPPLPFPLVPPSLPVFSAPDVSLLSQLVTMTGINGGMSQDLAAMEALGGGGAGPPALTRPVPSRYKSGPQIWPLSSAAGQVSGGGD